MGLPVDAASIFERTSKKHAILFKVTEPTKTRFEIRQEGTLMVCALLRAYYHVPQTVPCDGVTLNMSVL